LFRPQTGYYADLPEMAAALFESLLMGRPFIDGSRRVAFLRRCDGFAARSAVLLERGTVLQRRATLTWSSDFSRCASRPPEWAGLPACCRAEATSRCLRDWEGPVWSVSQG
jgi:hypothetical protein